MSRHIIMIGACLTLAAAFGWISASGEDASNREIRDPWPNSLNSVNEMSINDALLRLNASALFPQPTSRDGRPLGPDGKPIDADGAESASGATPPFPTIRGVSILDGRPHVTLELKGGAVETVAEGETLESGWQLKSVDPTRIIAAYKDEEITRPIRDYAPGG